jgi:hypothetical protein
VLGRLVLVGVVGGPLVGAVSGATVGLLGVANLGWTSFAAVAGACVGLVLGPVVALFGALLWVLMTGSGRRGEERERAAVGALTALPGVAAWLVLSPFASPSPLAWQHLVLSLVSGGFAVLVGWLVVPWCLGVPARRGHRIVNAGDHGTVDARDPGV